MSNFRLICFDLGRVLIRICDNWQHACRLAGVPVPEYPLADDARARLFGAVVQSEVGKVNLQAFLQVASPELGLTVEQVKAVSDVYLLEPFAGGMELLDDLDRAGFGTACLSNTNDHHWRMMFDPAGPYHGMLSRLRHAFASHLMELRKPDPRIYEQVERQTGVTGEQIVFFDDLIENIEGAHQRGWTAELIAREPNPVEQMRGHLGRMGIL